MKLFRFRWQTLCVVAIITFFGLSACEKFELCEDDDSTFTLKFRKDNEAETIFLEQLTISGTDAGIWEADTISTGQLILPLNPTDTQTTYFLKRTVTDTILSDTLTISYQVRDSIQSAECGIKHYFEYLKVHYSTFEADSIEVYEARLDNSPENEFSENNNQEGEENPNAKIITIYRSTPAAE